MIFTLTHQLFTAIWIGGMIIYVMIIIPTLKHAVPKRGERKKIITKINDNLIFLMLISMMMLFISGLIIIPGGHDDPIFLTFVNEYATYLTIKTYLFFLMFVVTVFKLSYVDRMKDPLKKYRNVTIIISLNIIIGLLIMYISIYLRYLL